MAKKRSCSAAKEALVATRRVGVGPGVKMDSHSCSKKDAMFAQVDSVSVKQSRWFVCVCVCSLLMRSASMYAYTL